MNKQITALITKLNWQVNELYQHYQETQKQCQLLIEQISEFDKQITQCAQTDSLHINPEFEINRLNFITQLQEKKEILKTTLKNHQEIEKKLENRIQRSKIELKMLNKYIEREKNTQKEQQDKKHNHDMDEWAIQREQS